MTRDEKIARAVASLRMKHNRASCDDACPTLLVLEALAEVQRELYEVRRECDYHPPHGRYSGS